MKPSEVMTAPRFDWSDYLQDHLTSPSVIVSQLHPIFGLRLAALFVDLTNAGYAAKFRILSGVRSKEKQIRIRKDWCARGRCEMAADPNRVHGPDGEGVQRAGSNHMPQLQPWGAEVGYAVDIRRDSSVAWSVFHSRLPIYGLDWPLKSSPYEPWHIEWFPRRNGRPFDGKIAWPRRPGVHRPLHRGALGGDVAELQRQLPELTVDGDYGPATSEAVKAFQRSFGRAPSGVWGLVEQTAHETGTALPEPPDKAAELAEIQDSIARNLAQASARLARLKVKTARALG